MSRTFYITWYAGPTQQEEAPFFHPRGPFRRASPQHGSYRLYSHRRACWANVLRNPARMPFSVRFASKSPIDCTVTGTLAAGTAG